jgi:hypothetical protein
MTPRMNPMRERDAAMRRVSRATKWIAGIAAALTGAFVLQAADAIPGHSKSTGTGSSSSSSTGATAPSGSSSSGSSSGSSSTVTLPPQAAVPAPSSNSSSGGTTRLVPHTRSSGS